MSEGRSGPNALLPVVGIENPAGFSNIVRKRGWQNSVTHPQVNLTPRSDLVAAKLRWTVSREP